jgi:hypothetical protein
VRSSLLPACVAAFVLLSSVTAADAATGFVMRYDVVGATGGYVVSPSGGMVLGMTAGEPAIGVAIAGGESIRETAGFWRPRGAFLVGVPDPIGPSEALFAFALMPITPNPAVRNATVRYVVPGSAAAMTDASVRVFDVSGRVVRVLASGPHSAGVHSVSWDGLNSAGARVDAGVFFVELAAGSNRSVHRVIWLR